MPSGPTSSSSSSNYSFESFLQGWFRRQSQLLADISEAETAVAASKGSGASAAACGGAVSTANISELVSRVLGHFEEFYEHKSRAAHLNVFTLFSPTWCSSFECAFFWVTGFRPAVLLQLVTDSVLDLSPDQTRALIRLRRETRMEERGVADELARIQENIAVPPLMEAIRGGNRHQIDEDYFTMMSESMEWLRETLEDMVANADNLRVTTAARVVEILNPAQCLTFLAAALRLQQGMRSWGIERDINRPTQSQREDITSET